MSSRQTGCKNFTRDRFNKPGHYDKAGKEYTGKRDKLKARMINTAKVKTKFAKEIDGKDDAFYKTPDFYSDIFAEVDQEQKNGRKRYSPSNSEDEDKVGEQSEAEDTEEQVKLSTPKKKEEVKAVKNPTNKRVNVVSHQVEKQNDEPAEKVEPKTEESEAKKSRPNPFKRTLEDLEQQKLELEKIKKEAKKQREEKMRLKAENLEKRKKDRYKLSRRSKSGQPVLANHISHILSKLEKK